MAPIKPGSNNSNDWKRTITVRFPRSDGERMVRRLVLQGPKRPVTIAPARGGCRADRAGSQPASRGQRCRIQKACELRAVGGHDLAFLSHGVGFACFRP